MSRNIEGAGSDGRNLLKAGEALVRLVRVWSTAGTRLKPAELQLMLDSWNDFANRTEGMTSMHIPKRHLTAHLIARVPWFGNTRRYGNWVDESLNRKLKAATRLVHQSTFEPLTLLRFRATLRKMRGVKRKR